MADVRLNIAGREYTVTCHDGEEGHLHLLGSLVGESAKEAAGSSGGLNETRHLLFTALLLADKLHDANAKLSSTPPTAIDNTSLSANTVGQMADTLEKLAGRIEAFAMGLEN